MTSEHMKARDELFALCACILQNPYGYRILRDKAGDEAALAYATDTAAGELRIRKKNTPRGDLIFARLDRKPREGLNALFYRLAKPRRESKWQAVKALWAQQDRRFAELCDLLGLQPTARFTERTVVARIVL
jgi:hypothetical protein